MHASVTVTPAQLPELLLHTAVVRPVFIWGQPGIGKSSMVEEFAVQVGLDCQTLLGTQLAAEDLIGVPRIVGEGDRARSRFCPPEAIARDEPYVLFLDELNGSSHEVQKAFYSLILDRRLGSYKLHPESVVIGAGNRSQDSAIVRPMSSALINRMVHVHLVSSPRDWLAWARRSGIHPWVIDYLSQRPDHLTTTPPRHEEPFSTPRAWHILSDLLHSYGAGSTGAGSTGAGTAGGPELSDELLRILTLGTVSPTHAGQFRGYVRQLRHAWSLDALLKGTMHWPSDPAERDVCYFLAQGLRARLAKELPASRSEVGSDAVQLAHRAKALLTELAEISVEAAQLVVAGAGDGASEGDGEDGTDARLPSWFMVEVVRDLPRLAAARDGVKA
jgi:AAA domain (dynein-related subfamily)